MHWEGPNIVEGVTLVLLEGTVLEGEVLEAGLLKGELFQGVLLEGPLVGDPLEGLLTGELDGVPEVPLEEELIDRVGVLLGDDVMHIETLAVWS